jgi:hypothetical protein
MAMGPYAKGSPGSACCRANRKAKASCEAGPYSLQPVQASRKAAAAERPQLASLPLQVSAVSSVEHEGSLAPVQQIPTHTL